MTETTAEKQRGRPFARGVSGNPRGRPKGARNKATRIAQDLLDGESADLVRVAIDLAKKGEPVALRLCIERLVPVRRSSPAEVELPEVAKAEDVAEAARAIIAAAGRGELSLGEAREWMALLDKQRGAIETGELAVRLELLEESQRAKTDRYGRRQ